MDAIAAAQVWKATARSERDCDVRSSWFPQRHTQNTPLFIPARERLSREFQADVLRRAINDTGFQRGGHKALIDDLDRQYQRFATRDRGRQLAHPGHTDPGLGVNYNPDERIVRVAGITVPQLKDGKSRSRRPTHQSTSHSRMIVSYTLRACSNASAAAARSVSRMNGDLTSHSLSTQARHHCALRLEARMGLPPTRTKIG